MVKLLAVNELNTVYIKEGYEIVYNQGELFKYLKDNHENIEEILIDPSLPGNVTVSSMVRIIREKYPEIGVSVLEDYKVLLEEYKELSKKISSSSVDKTTSFSKQLIFVLVACILSVIAYIIIQKIYPAKYIWLIAVGFGTLGYIAINMLEMEFISGRNK